MVSVPSNPTYAIKGGDVFLNWTYESPSEPILKRWYQADSNGNELGLVIMSISPPAAPSTLNPSFIGRATYVANAGLRITNVSLSDEGPTKFHVFLKSGRSIASMVTLIVTSKLFVSVDLLLEAILKSVQLVNPRI